MTRLRDASVVIQAGGRSQRMGRDKGLVSLGGRMMVEYVMDVVTPLADDVLITTNNAAMYAYFGLRLVRDREPGAGALPGLLTALSASSGEYVLVVGCDMPFLCRPLLIYQLEQAFATGKDVVVPLWDDRWQPLHAVYHRERCRTAVETFLAAGGKKLQALLETLDAQPLSPAKVREFSPEGRTFFNVNTPQELARAEEMLAG